MGDTKLVLHPVDPWTILQDPDGLLQSLRNIGAIGSPFSHVGELHYKAGPRFGEYVAFSSAAPPDAAACHVSLLETTEVPAFLGASNAQPPACAGCQAPLADWKAQLVEWQAAPQRYRWSCARCGRKAPVQELAWGDTGGIARCSLDVWNVPPGEARPSIALLAHLEAETYVAWRYFYYRF